MAGRRYKRPDGVASTACVSIALTCWADGTFTGSISAWGPEGDRVRHVRLPRTPLDGTVAPPGVEALAIGGQLALDLWSTGQLPS